MGQAGTAAREQGHLAELCWGQRAQGWPHASQAPHLLQALVGFSPSGVLYEPWSWGCLPSQFSSSKPMRWQQQERGQSTECPALHHQNAMHASASQGRVLPAASSPQPWAPPSGSSHQPATGGWGVPDMQPTRGAPRALLPSPSPCSRRLPGPLKRMNHPCCCQLRTRHQDSPPTPPGDRYRLRGEPCRTPTLG